MKRSDIHHVTFHVAKTAVMLSVTEKTTLPDLRDQLVAALAPLAPHLSTLPPTDPSDIQLWDDRYVEGAEGDQGIRALLTEDESMMTIKELGWGRWKRLYLSFRGPDGEFPKPVYTVPNPEDGEEEEEQQQ